MTTPTYTVTGGSVGSPASVRTTFSGGPGAHLEGMSHLRETLEQRGWKPDEWGTEYQKEIFGATIRAENLAEAAKAEFLAGTDGDYFLSYLENIMRRAGYHNLDGLWYVPEKAQTTFEALLMYVYGAPYAISG